MCTTSHRYHNTSSTPSPGTTPYHLEQSLYLNCVMCLENNIQVIFFAKEKRGHCFDSLTLVLTVDCKQLNG